MTVLNPNADPAPDRREKRTEARIKEARPRRRRLWLLRSAIAVLAASTITGATMLESEPAPTARAASVRPRRVLRPATRSLVPSEPTSIAAVDGDLYVADPARQEILRRSPGGSFSIVAGTGAAGFSGDGGPATRARIDDPRQLVALKNGSLLFEQVRPDQGPVIRELTPRGAIRTVIGLHPNCAGLAPGAIAIAANSAPAAGGLSVAANGLPLLTPTQPLPMRSPQPCRHSRHLGPYLELTTSGALTDTSLDASPLIRSLRLTDCGLTASALRFTVYGCESGAGGTKFAHPAELLVARGDRSFSSYPNDISEPDLTATSTTGEIVAAHNDSIVQVTASALVTLADERDLGRVFPGTTGVAGINGLAVDRSGDVYIVANFYAGNRHGCGDAIAELTTAGHLKRLWRSATGRICG